MGKSAHALRRGGPSSRGAFTLIEILVAGVLSALLTGIAVYAFVQSRWTVTLASARGDAFQNARAVLRTLEREIKSMAPGAADFSLKKDIYTDEEGEHAMDTLEFRGDRKSGGRGSFTRLRYGLTGPPAGRPAWMRALSRTLPFTTGDDDGDGTVDEDAVDGTDNDADGRFDEDAGAEVEEEMALYVTDFLAEAVAPGGASFGGSPDEDGYAFRNLADPPPAVRVTLKVADRQGRSRWIFRRVISVPAGMPR